MKKRLDELLLARGLVPSRSRARDAILRGLVTVDGVVAAKAGAQIADGAVIDISPEAGTAFVSRGALKLRAALDAFEFDAAGRTALDAGASTGGFTQVLLQAGARRVYAIDVGHEQLHSSLRGRDDVVSREGQDVRALSVADFDDAVTALTIDLSFISLTKVLPGLMDICAPGAWLVALIKPQFEVGREGVGKGGLVKDAGQRDAAVARISELISQTRGWRVAGMMPSPIEGGSGNIEYLVGATRDE